MSDSPARSRPFEAKTKPANVAPSARRTMTVDRLTPRACSHTTTATPGRLGRLARALDLHEHQGKELFRRHGIPVSEGRLATTPAEARAAADEIGYPVVVKAQVLIGGRGKAGGIKLAADAEEVEARAGQIL